MPDAKTVWVGRERLKQPGWIGDIREAVGRQLAQAGSIARGGQITDASIVTAPAQHHRGEENETRKGGDMPADWSAAKRAQKDIEARWTKKHAKSYYGYKLHASADRRRGFIRRPEVTATLVNDTEVFEAILDDSNTGKDVYADRGYAKHERETALYVQGYRAPSSAKARPGSRSARRSGGATGASPNSAPSANTRLRAWHRWAANTCARWVWHAHGR